MDKDYNNISIQSFNDSNYYNNYQDCAPNIVVCNGSQDGFIRYVVTWIIISIGLPLTLVAIIALYSLLTLQTVYKIWRSFDEVRNDHVAPIYVINLFISDLIQLCSLIPMMSDCDWLCIANYTYDFGLVASVGFMVCVSLERYLVIAWPLWYRFRRTIKVYVVVCVVVWTLPIVYILLLYFWVDFEIIKTAVAVFLLFPFPLFMFFLGGTLKTLSGTRSVPSDEKRRIVAILVVVLLIYTLLFLPTLITWLSTEALKNCIFLNLSIILLRLSPLADLTLYIFIRKDDIDKLLVSLRCCRMENNPQMNSTNNDTVHSVSVV